MKYSQKAVFECGIVPVIKINDAKDAVNTCQALLDGGINIAEITFRTDAAEQAIKNVSENLEDVLVGAGTVLNVENAKKAIAAGAKFIVCPSFNEKTVEFCLEQNVPVIPGTCCPGDIEKGLSYGLEVLKFFPAEMIGGVKTLREMSSPYGMVKFMPTGGINTDNLLDYISFDKVIACGGTWMVKEDYIDSGNFDEITKLTRQAVEKLHNFQFFHMAINTENQDAALSVAGELDSLFNTGVRETGLGAFAGNFIEIISAGEKAQGKNGHIGFKTPSVGRAIAYFEKRGIEMDYDTLRGTRENPTFIYFKKQIGNFAIHLIQI